MTTSRMTAFVQELRCGMVQRDGAAFNDGQVLEAYISHRDQTALADLVLRHGPMVWGVCRRVLSNHHDAEDAFQATFLVLVRKAASIVPREMVANWLYGVAHQTALKARATAAKRKGRERQVATMPEPAAIDRDLQPDLQPLLDDELSRLPDKYRVLIVLCDLEGKTRKEAARQLGVPEGTVAGRLARARTMLARRLTQRGITLTSGALALLSQSVGSADVPLALISSTIKVATLVAVGQAAAAGAISVKVAALTEGVIKAMFITKLMKATAVLVLAVVVAGSGGFTYWAQAEEPGQPAGQSATPRSGAEKAKNQEVLQKQVDDAKRDLKKAKDRLAAAQADVAVAEANLATKLQLLNTEKATQPKLGSGVLVDNDFHQYESISDLIWRKFGVTLNPVGRELTLKVNPLLRGGLRVIDVRAESPAARSGILKGDILVGLCIWVTLTPENVVYAIEHRHSSTPAPPQRVYVIRDDKLFNNYLRFSEEKVDVWEQPPPIFPLADTPTPRIGPVPPVPADTGDTYTHVCKYKKAQEVAEVLNTHLQDATKPVTITVDVSANRITVCGPVDKIQLAKKLIEEADKGSNPILRSGPSNVALPPGQVAQPEEELIVLYAQRDVQMAQVKAAEVGVAAAKLTLQRGQNAEALSNQDRDKAQIDLAAAQAQLDIRKAELNVVDAKIKIAKTKTERGGTVEPAAPQRQK